MMTAEEAASTALMMALLLEHVRRSSCSLVVGLLRERLAERPRAALAEPERDDEDRDRYHDCDRDANAAVVVSP